MTKIKRTAEEIEERYNILDTIMSMQKEAHCPKCDGVTDIEEDVERPVGKASIIRIVKMPKSEDMFETMFDGGQQDELSEIAKEVDKPVSLEDFEKDECKDGLDGLSVEDIQEIGMEVAKKDEGAEEDIKKEKKEADE